MELLTSVICDSASDYNGKLCVLGAFDTIWSLKYPSQHVQCTLAFRFLFDNSDIGRHEFEVDFLNADGQPLLPKGPIKFGITMGAIPNQQYFLSRNLVVNLQNLPLPGPGQYAFDIRCNNEVLSRIPLQAVQGKPPPPSRPPDQKA